MRELEEELADPPFVRVHRSAIVNVGRVREVRHRSHGDFEAELSNGTVVRVSRTRRDGLLASMGGRGRRA
jgi:two-component system LytT family response regulator